MVRRSAGRFALTGVALIVWAACAAVVEYSVTAAPGQAAVGVTVTVVVKGDVLRFQIPAWTPGAYVLQRHFRAIEEVSAKGVLGDELTVSREDDITWSVAAKGERRVTLAYRVKRDVIPASGLQIAGPSTYMYVVGRKEEACTVRFLIPSGWRVAIGLDALGENSYRAPNYDVLADAPAQLGHFNIDEFKVRGVPHQIVTFGDGADQVDRKRLSDVCRRIVECQTTFFADIPYRRYVFLFSARPGQDGAGGLEHLNSTSIWLSSGLGPRVIHVIAHEFFHLWNVKRIRPVVLGPFDYTRPVPTRNLWWSEGVTDYYAALLNHRAGLLGSEEFYAMWERDIEKLQETPARLSVSADECSVRTWEGGTHSGYGGLNYYLKGKLVGLCLDLKIRTVTDGRKSLDDVVRLLYDRCGRGKGPGFPEDGIRDACIEIGGPELGAFYDRVARSTEELPFGEVFAGIGVRCMIRVAEDQKSVTVSVTPNNDCTRRQERLRDGWTTGRTVVPSKGVTSLRPASDFDVLSPVPAVAGGA